jgi:hypothetical protein
LKEAGIDTGLTDCASTGALVLPVVPLESLWKSVAEIAVYQSSIASKSRDTIRRIFFRPVPFGPLCRNHP